eukprot:2163525-Rhodomonas_salina.1
MGEEASWRRPQSAGGLLIRQPSERCVDALPLLPAICSTFSTRDPEIPRDRSASSQGVRGGKRFELATVRSSSSGSAQRKRTRASVCMLILARCTAAEMGDAEQGRQHSRRPREEGGRKGGRARGREQTSC